MNEMLKNAVGSVVSVLNPMAVGDETPLWDITGVLQTATGESYWVELGDEAAKVVFYPSNVKRVSKRFFPGAEYLIRLKV